MKMLMTHGSNAPKLVTLAMFTSILTVALHWYCYLTYADVADNRLHEFIKFLLGPALMLGVSIFDFLLTSGGLTGGRQ